MSKDLREICVEHGLTILTVKDGVTKLTHAPITTRPSLTVPRQAFIFAAETLGPIWNRLVDRMARDSQFLLTTLRGSDSEFTEPLLDILERVYVSPSASHTNSFVEHLAARQSAMLGVFRSDYLFVGETTDTRPPWRHVEINTISAAFPALSSRAGTVHSELFQKTLSSTENIPISTSERDVVDALCSAHAHFQTTYSDAEAVVCFVVGESERNTGDQKLLADGLQARNITVVRLSLQFMAGSVSSQNTPALRVTSDGAAEVCSGGSWHRVALFYFRSCYDVSDFPTPESWAAREAIEASTAIKCPSLPYHLCTWKKIQQSLLDPKTIRRFLIDEEAKLLESVMVDQVRLDSDRAEHALLAAEHEPSAWVLKTQKEGTGKLYAGEEMVGLIARRKDNPEDFAKHFAHEHLLMEKIFSVKVPGSILKNDELVQVEDLEAEFGAFSTILSSGDKIFHNRPAGHLVRTKPGSQANGGVMSGVAALDSVIVI